MPIILSIETSTKACSAAIHQDGKLLSVSELYNEKSSSGMLTTLIEHVVKTASLKLQDIDAVAVAKGPGSYTGLRIGVSTAKGLCFTLEKPLIAINTLEAMAFSIYDLNSQNPVTNNQSPITNLLCPMLDARRMEVYCAIYKADTLEILESTQAKIIDEISFSDLLENHQIIFFGDGAEKCRATLGSNPKAVFLNQTIFPSARSIGALATRAFEQQQFENVADFEPFYLKEFVGTTPNKISL